MSCRLVPYDPFLYHFSWFCFCLYCLTPCLAFLCCLLNTFELFQSLLNLENLLVNHSLLKCFFVFYSIICVLHTHSPYRQQAHTSKHPCMTDVLPVLSGVFPTSTPGPNVQDRVTSFLSPTPMYYQSPHWLIPPPIPIPLALSHLWFQVLSPSYLNIPTVWPYPTLHASSRTHLYVILAMPPPLKPFC